MPDHEKKKSAKAAARAEAKMKKLAEKDEAKLDKLLKREYNEELEKSSKSA
jgi:hypothetical protein